jgi:hypothetical protein
VRQLDHERLDVYDLALEFLVLANGISPRRACTPPPQYRFDEVAIVTPRTPGAFPHAQRCFDPLALPLIQLQAHHRGHPMEHTGGSMESPLF